MEKKSKKLHLSKETLLALNVKDSKVAKAALAGGSLLPLTECVTCSDVISYCGPC